MQIPSKRGRPPEADPDQVLGVALRLFERRGFDRVTMDEIAAAASISRRTLFRLFPSKADLVWGGLNEVRDAVMVQLASLHGAALQPTLIIDELFAPILHRLDDPGAAETARRRLRLIARTPALLNHETLREIADAIVSTVGSDLAAGAPPSLIGRTFFAAAFAALLWWAEHGEGMTAVEATRAAFRAMALASSAGEG